MRDSLVVVHSHWRVGGVRSVIESVLPAIARESGWPQIIFVAGEAAPPTWLGKIQKKVQDVCAPSVVREVVLPEVGYVSEMKKPPGVATLRRRWESFVRAENPAALWWHNPGLGRNVPAVEALLQVVGETDFPLLFHHHDLWCDHRWKRWGEMQSCGYRQVDEVARVLFTNEPGVFHLTINARDAALFRAALGNRARKLGNPFDPPPAVTVEEKKRARRWLQEQTGTNSGTPLWLAPCRLLRRKNLLESLLLLHRHSKRGVLVTSNLVASRDEQAYAHTLEELAQMESARLRLVDFGSPGAPRMSALQAASEALVQSSLQEGFGLLFMEAAQAGSQFLCRRLPNVWPDLLERGCDFPMSYEEVPVDLLPGERQAEARRQAEVFANWKCALPEPWQPMVGKMNFLDAYGGGDGQATAFSRLTLNGQLTVLLREINQPHCVPLDFKPATRPQEIRDFTSAEYAKQFLEIVGLHKQFDFTPDVDAAVRLQNSLVRDALAPQNAFPILLPPSPDLPGLAIEETE